MTRAAVPAWFLFVGLAGMWLPTMGVATTLLFFLGLAVVAPILAVSARFWLPQVLNRLTCAVQHTSAPAQPDKMVHASTRNPQRTPDGPDAFNAARPSSIAS